MSQSFVNTVLRWFGFQPNQTLVALKQKLDAAEVSGNYLHAHYMGREFSVELEEDFLLISATCQTAVKLFLGFDLEKSNGFYAPPYHLSQSVLSSLQCMCATPERFNDVLANEQCVGELARLFSVGQAHLLTEPLEGYVQIDWQQIDIEDLTPEVLIEVVGSVCYVAACLESI